MYCYRRLNDAEYSISIFKNTLFSNISVYCSRSVSALEVLPYHFVDVDIFLEVVFDGIFFEWL